MIIPSWLLWLAGGSIVFVGIATYLLNWYLNKHGDQYDRRGWR